MNPSLHSLTVEQIPITSLHEDPANVRRHDRKNLDAIKSSLRRFGQQKPVVVDTKDIVRAGNGTLAAAKELGWTTIAAVRTNLSGSELAAYAIADNRSAELAIWDDEGLAKLLTELKTEDEALFAAVGFDDEAYNQLLDEILGDKEVVEDEAPEAQEVVISQPGDLWHLGASRVLCGDSTTRADVERVLTGEKPRLMLTDPPYGVSLDMEWRDRAGLNGLGPAQPSYMKRAEGHKNTSISGDTQADWSAAFELVPSLDTCYCWHASAYATEVALGLKRIGFEIKQQIIWKKPQLVLSRQHYHWIHEPCWYARKTGSKPFRGSRDQTTVWEAASPKMIMSGRAEEAVDHPTQKPCALYTRPIENHLERGECFYEPFAGSGTAIVAAEQTGRRCIAIEIDPRYIDVIVRRWQKFTGVKAKNETRPEVEVR